MNESVWSFGEMVPSRQDWSTLRRTCCSATLSTINLTWTVPVCKLGPAYWDAGDSAPSSSNFILNYAWTFNSYLTEKHWSCVDVDVCFFAENRVTRSWSAYLGQIGPFGVMAVQVVTFLTSVPTLRKKIYMIAMETYVSITGSLVFHHSSSFIHFSCSFCN